MTAGRRASLASFAGTWALLTVFRAHAPLHLDTARDLLIARDCVLGPHCPGAGPRSSFAGLMQGASWSHLLELREHLGWSLAAVERVADLLLACAAAMVPLVARRIGAPANALTWALWLPATLLTIGYPRLWNPTPWPLALVLTFLALLHGARSGSALAFAAASGALALAVDVHVATGVMVPLCIFVVAATARRPALALVPAGAIFVGALALASPGAFAENRATLGPYAPALLGGLALSVAAGLAARRRMLAGSEEQRAWWVAAGASGYGVVVMTSLSLASGHGLDPRYFAPVVTPAAIVVGARLPIAPRLRMAAAALVVAGHVALWAVQRATDPQLRLVEAEPIAAELYGRGLAFGDLYRHLRGPRVFDLVATLAALEPADGRVAGGLDADLLVVRSARAALPSPLPDRWRVVELGGGQVAVIVELPAPLDVARVEVCVDDRCESIAVDVERFAQRADTHWSMRAHAGMADLSRRFAGVAAATYRLTRIAGASATRFALFGDDCQQWRVEAEAEVVAFTVTPGRRCRWWLPPFVGVPERDTALSALVAAAGGKSPQ